MSQATARASLAEPAAGIDGALAARQTRTRGASADAVSARPGAQPPLLAVAVLGSSRNVPGQRLWRPGSGWPRFVWCAGVVSGTALRSRVFIV